jgi:CDP-glucose 4,6-dehydratase
VSDSNKEYWSGKNVFITGINGFIGGNLAKSLINQGANVFGLLRNQRKDTFLYYESLSNKINFINGELTDPILMKRIISEEQINVVFHLAAQVEIGVGITNPYLTFETNIKGTYTLAQAIADCPKTIESVIMASTDKAYGSYGKEKMPYKEDYPLIPIYPYDVSKACSDMIARCYASDIFNLPIVVTRFCNIYGPGQLNFSALIPDAIRSALEYSTFHSRGDGSQERDFIYVEDVVELYLSMAEALSLNPKKYMGEVFNAGTNRVHTVQSVIEKVYNLLDNKVALEKIKKNMVGKKTVGEIECQYMDYEKVNHFFKWEPKHSFDDGLLKTIKWFTGYLKKDL